MFKDRTFLIGLGAGLIIGTLLLQMMLLGQTVSTELTEQQLVREADRQGFDLVPKGTVLSEEKVKDNDKKSSDDSKQLKQAQKPAIEDKNNPQPPAESKPKAVKPVESKPEQSKKPKTNESVVKVFLPSQSNSVDIAKLLENAGVVENADQFQQYIQQQKKARNLRTGNFQFELPMTEEEVLATLLQAPNG